MQKPNIVPFRATGYPMGQNAAAGNVGVAWPMMICAAGSQFHIRTWLDYVL